MTARRELDPATLALVERALADGRTVDEVAVTARIPPSTLRLRIAEQRRQHGDHWGRPAAVPVVVLPSRASTPTTIEPPSREALLARAAIVVWDAMDHSEAPEVRLAAAKIAAGHPQLGTPAPPEVASRHELLARVIAALSG